MKKEIEAAKYLIYTASYLVDKGKPDPVLSSASKWHACEICQYIVDEALLIYGGYGYTTDYRLERIFRDAKVLMIVEGTKEAEEMAIAREILR